MICAGNKLVRRRALMCVSTKQLCLYFCVFVMIILFGRHSANILFHYAGAGNINLHLLLHLQCLLVRLRKQNSHQNKERSLTRWEKCIIVKREVLWTVLVCVYPSGWLGSSTPQVDRPCKYLTELIWAELKGLLSDYHRTALKFNGSYPNAIVS